MSSSWLVGVTQCACSERSSRRNRVSLNDDYGVLIDAGSTGTRVWVYSWPRDKDDGTVEPPGQTVPPIECLYTFKVPKGLAEYAEDPQRLREVVVTLIGKAKAQVPDKLHSTTSIFLMATAGMRFLLEEKAVVVVEEIDKVFQNTSLNPFMYDSPHNTRILSGEEEGVFAWIAVNYLSGRLTNLEADLYKSTSGILELGGASTQIAFIPRGSVLSDKFPVFIGGEKYPIYVHSYLHYGQDYVGKAIEDKLIKEHPHDDTFHNPCMLKGENLTNAQGKQFIGTGDPSQCVAVLERVIYKVDSHRCHPKPCAIGSVYQPNIPPSQTFYTVGAFYFILNDLKVLSVNGTFTPAQAYEAAFNFCSKDFEELKAELKPSPEREMFISKPCSIGLYMSLLFTRGYGFNNHTQQIIAAEKIHGHPIDWTLGALIYENDYRMNSQCRKNQNPPLPTSPTAGSKALRQQLSLQTFSTYLLLLFLSVSYRLRSSIASDEISS